MSDSIFRRDLEMSELTIAGVMTPAGFQIASAKALEETSSQVFQPNIWLTITPDNSITVIVAKSEMGQGVYTSLPMIVADELEADWEKVKVEVAPARKAYEDPFWQEQWTGSSNSVKDSYEILRQAGATAREMLIHAAALEWNVSPEQCVAAKNMVEHKPTARYLSYGQLCLLAAQLPIPTSVKLKSESQFNYIGKSMPQIGALEYVNGSAIFGTDVFVKDMLYAAIARPPAYGAKVISFQEESAQQVEGVKQIVKLPHQGIAVCADTIESAWKGVEALKVIWDHGLYPDLNTETLLKAHHNALNQKGNSAKNQGDVHTALRQTEKKFKVVYELPYVHHATIEPPACTVHVQEHQCDIWAPTQAQTKVLKTAIQVTGLKSEQIHVHTTLIGGSFGRKSEKDFVEETILLSKATGKPVKLIWTRAEDIQHGWYRPANVSVVEVGIDNRGQITAWYHKIACASTLEREYPFLIKNGIDHAVVKGITDMDYDIPNFSVDYVMMTLPVPVTCLRSVGYSHNTFVVETIIDELAFLANIDPLTFRLNHLQHDHRASRVLEVVAEKAGWGKPVKKGRGIGLAQYFFVRDSYLAQVAEVSVTDGIIKVHRVICAIDCGMVIHPDTVKSQMESGIIMGLSMALKEQITFAKGGVQSSNFDNYNLLQMDETPAIEVHIVNSDEKPRGLGESGLSLIAPAVANAVFSLTGVRLRRLPFLI